VLQIVCVERQSFETIEAAIRHTLKIAKRWLDEQRCDQNDTAAKEHDVDASPTV
jgi:hypothetical protein